MRQFITVAVTACICSNALAFDFGKLIPKNPQDLIPYATGGGAAVLCRSLFSGSREKNVAMVVCGSLGVLVGVKLKQHLQEREQVQLAQATDKTLSTGQTQSFKTDQGATVTTEIIKESPNANTGGTALSPTAPPNATIAASGCGAVKQTLVTSDGQRFEDTVNACKNTEGVWVAA